jgi:hypothetical protein
MGRRTYVLALVMLFALPTMSFSASFKVYPGAKLEEIYQPRQPEVGGKASRAHKTIIFTTNDFFENVVAFYRGIAREYRIPGSGGKPTKLPSGHELKEAYFILDNAADIMSSEHWIKIQRPYLGRDPMGQGFHEKSGISHDVTAIIEEDRRGYP